MAVSKPFPFHNLGEYHRNWITSRLVQNTPMTKQRFLPREVVESFSGELRARTPISNTRVQ